jgi:tripartite-type tricarboxylate transporter receptor subunit TctC
LLRARSGERTNRGGLSTRHPNQRGWALRLHNGIALIAASWLAVAYLTSAPRADEWPSKPVKIVIPFGAGGTSDRFGRLIATELSRVFKQPFYVENKPGAAGATGSAEVARAQPDGYTLVIAGMGPNLTGPALNPNIGYDPINDFSHIAMIAGDSTSFVVTPGLGVKTLPEFIALAKSGRVSLTCGSSGVGTMGHLSLEQFRRTAGVMDLVHVPYRGGGPLAIDLLGNHLSAAFIATASGIEQVRGGKVIPLAVTASERISTLKDVPTFAELGYSSVESTTWGWISGPSHMPAEIVTKVNRAVRDFVDTAEMRQRFAAESMIVKKMDAAALTAFLAGELRRWTALVSEAGLREK